MDINVIIKLLSKELDLPEKVIENTYKSYWFFIKELIEKLPLKEDITEEEFNKLNTSFNVPKLGKFYLTYKDLVNIKRRYNLYLKK